MLRSVVILEVDDLGRLLISERLWNTETTEGTDVICFRRIRFHSYVYCIGGC